MTTLKTQNLTNYPYLSTGTVALPHLLLYSHAASLIRVVDWCHCHATKLWTPLENDLISPDLTSLLWLAPDQRPSKDLLPFTVLATLQTWDKGLLSSRPSPLTLLFGLTFFSSPLTGFKFLCWHRQDCALLSHTLCGRTLVSLSQILPSCHSSSRAWLEYTQLKPYLNTRPFIDLLTWPCTALELLLSQSSRPDHILSKIYQILLRESYPHPSPFLLKWEQELQISPEDMD